MKKLYLDKYSNISIEELCMGQHFKQLFYKERAQGNCYLHAEISNQLTSKSTIIYNLQKQITQIQKENVELKTQVKKLQFRNNKLTEITHVRIDSPLTKDQEGLFRELFRDKEINGNDGMISEKNRRGPPRSLLLIRDVPSDVAGKTTVRLRCSAMENFEFLNSSHYVEDNKFALQVQRSSHFLRNKTRFQTALKIEKTTLSQESLLQLKGKLPWTVLR